MIGFATTMFEGRSRVLQTLLGKRTNRRRLRRLENEALVELQNNDHDWVVKITGLGSARLVTTSEEGAENTGEAQRMPRRTEAFSGDWLFEAVSRAVLPVQGRMDLPLRILTDYLTRNLITPEIAWKELQAMPSDGRYSGELRRWISNELAHLSQPQATWRNRP